MLCFLLNIKSFKICLQNRVSANFHVKRIEKCTSPKQGFRKNKTCVEKCKSQIQMKSQTWCGGNVAGRRWTISEKKRRENGAWRDRR